MRNPLWWMTNFTWTRRWIGLLALGQTAFFLGLVCIADRYFIDLSNFRWEHGVALAGLGFIVTYFGFRWGLKGMMETLSPFTPVNVYDFLQKDITKKRGPRIVVIGGGTGLSVLLKGLKQYTSKLTAIVTVTDDGGSSGILRGELGVLPPGDIRNCLVALAETENLMDQVFQHRFKEGSVQGHNLGNLLLTALTDISGDFVGAIKQVSQVLAVQGQVLPATLEQVTLEAIMDDGSIVKGETAITRAGRKIEKLSLNPSDCRALPEAVAAIREADAVIIGPGSLYTSIIANLLVKEIGEAVRETRATRIFTVNIMTQPGETTCYTAADHIKTTLGYLGEGTIDYVILNNEVIDEARLGRYLADGAQPVQLDHKEILSTGVTPVYAPLLGKDDVAWHEPAELARAIMKTIYSRKGLMWVG
ncbi:MAG: gluconeogenesis factor YvcK family protein [Chitinophagales bacterium]